MCFGLNIFGLSLATVERLAGANSRWVEGMIDWAMCIVTGQKMDFLTAIRTIFQTRNEDMPSIAPIILEIGGPEGC